MVVGYLEFAFVGVGPPLAEHAGTRGVEFSYRFGCLPEVFIVHRFVAERPHYHRGMRAECIDCLQMLAQVEVVLYGGIRIALVGPAEGRFHLHEHSQFVGGVEQRFVRRIMRCAYVVHVGTAEQLHIPAASVGVG